MVVQITVKVHKKIKDSYILVRIMLKNDDFLKTYNAKYDSLHLEGLPGNCYFYCHLRKH